ncbi:MAG: hypothetical protein L0271_22665, partial [Gemmatimonadetes bacterium]|nr:hypothetical protein [Gemmatimonadota bacterium]
ATESGLGITLTICTPGGYDPVVPGGVLHVEIENASAAPRTVAIAFEGCWRHSLATIVTTRETAAAHRLVHGERSGCIALEIDDGADGAALSLSAGTDATCEAGVRDATAQPLSPGQEVRAQNGEALRFRITRTLQIGPGRRSSAALYAGVAQDRDGAFAAGAWLERLGAAELIRLGRLELARIARSAEGPLRDLAGRNLAFHHYNSVARAIDDERMYPVLSRSPAHGACAVFSERAALAWSLPAHNLTDPMLARELYIRILEQYSDRPGRVHRYLDGAALTRGFSLANLCEYVLALERYVDTTRDDSLLEDALVSQVLREVDEAVYSRLHPEIFLAETEVLASGDRSDYPYASFDNVLMWRLCRALSKLGPPASQPRFRMAGGEEEAAAAFWQRCAADVDGLHVIAGSTDTKGGVAVYDDPAGSLRLLPFLEFCDEEDPIWANTMDLLHSRRYPLWHGAAPHPGLARRSRPGEASFAALCADLLGPYRERAVATLQGLDLPAGIACETWDPATGKAASGPWAAGEAGFLVWAILTEPNPPERKRAR